MHALTETETWKKLSTHAASMRLHTLNDLHQKMPHRHQHFQTATSAIQCNYANQRITDETLKLLMALTDQCGLREKIHALMTGDILNQSEHRPALHTALRASGDVPIWVNDHNVMRDIMQTRDQMRIISEQIRSQQWLGFSNKPITDIVNIGIGGSHLGANFCISALAAYVSPTLRSHFISDLDPNSFKQTVSTLNPEATLFIINSKSFTTHETLHHAQQAKSWIGHKPHADRHFIAVTAHQERAKQLGFRTILSIWDWIGGRYSFCSAVNLISTIAIGFDAFNNMLAGARSMDQHFRDTAFSNNLPVLLALLGLWNNNFLNTHHLLMLAYAQQLEQFIPYVQQLDMESNGKSVDNQGKSVTYATGPIIWGGLGNHAQHSYYQLLCQGTHHITVDVLTLDTFQKEPIHQISTHKMHVLTRGVTHEDTLLTYVPGNLTLNHIQLRDDSPFTLGALVALYEHKIFTQGILWNINSFDQPGVERAKRQAFDHA